MADSKAISRDAESLKQALFSSSSAVANVVTAGPQRTSSYSVGRQIDAAIERAVKIGVRNAAILKAR